MSDMEVYSLPYLALRKFDWTAGQPDQVTVQHYHTDMVGTTRFITDWTGDGIDSAAYTAFGERISGTQHRYGYLGASGVEAASSDDPGEPYLGFRSLHLNSYYDPATGRSLQRNTSGIAVGLNVYASAGGGPEPPIVGGLIPRPEDIFPPDKWPPRWPPPKPNPKPKPRPKPKPGPPPPQYGGDWRRDIHDLSDAIGDLSEAIGKLKSVADPFLWVTSVASAVVADVVISGFLVWWWAPDQYQVGDMTRKVLSCRPGEMLWK